MLVTSADLPYEVMILQATYVTVLVLIHSRAWLPPVMRMVLRGPLDLSLLFFGCTPRRRAGMSRPSWLTPMLRKRTCVVKMEAMRRIQGVMTDSGRYSWKKMSVLGGRRDGVKERGVGVMGVVDDG